MQPPHDNRFTLLQATRIHDNIGELNPRALIVAIQAACQHFFKAPFLRIWVDWMMTLHERKVASDHQMCSLAVTIREALVTGGGRGAGSAQDNVVAEQKIQTARELLLKLKPKFPYFIVNLTQNEDFVAALVFYARHVAGLRRTNPTMDVVDDGGGRGDSGIGDARALEALNARLPSVQENLKGWKKLLDLQKACDALGLVLDERVVEGFREDESEAFLSSGLSE